ncbi:restriction endonuclease subunit S [Mitsuokella sp. AF21-1AC]|uniref:restriction endonuclease subunit S n=1 Tax=Mitsuokella sp. AF21-1AC TaxID=2292235 RepID=UPI000E4A3DA6|nr:restriction endonuclease subunit S [Mitsuokella sp. AF21-1AC]RGS74781.1 restriction endonuclease subunit S [Mitsuokella sp. AF21-1AC]
MAKKKQEMTPEERLAAALVPGEEQPYQLPEGWKWVYLGKITTIVGGGTPSSSHPEYYDGGEVPWITPADLSNYHEVYISRGKKNITEQGLAKSSTKLMPPNTVLLSSRAPIGYVAIAENDICTNQGFKSFLPSVHFEPRYLYWFFKGNQTLLTQYASGTTFLELSARRAGEIKFPIAPISEQQRLVARIESLFAKLDAAKEKVQSVLDDHETRKAALLHDAFAGKLTAKWRKEYEIDAPAYRSVVLAEVCDSIFDGDHMPPPKSSSGIPFLVISNVNTGKLNFSDTRFVPQDYYDALTDTRKPQNGDVLYTLVGTYGIPVLVDTDRAFCFQRHMALLKLKKDVILQRYLWYALQEKNFYRKATKIAKGTAQLTVPIKGLRQLTIPMASLLEQQEIVRILDRLLGREELVRQSAESVLETIDRMKQSILARAFRGEL